MNRSIVIFGFTVVRQTIYLSNHNVEKLLTGNKSVNLNSVSFT